MRSLVLLTLLLLVGCYASNLDKRKLRCGGSSGACPAPLVCGCDGLCHAEPVACEGFGGLFEERAAPCMPLCQENNYTKGCSCPAGTSPLRFATSTACSGAVLTVCQADAATESWGGIFFETDGASDCSIPNPYTGTCSCGAGFSDFRARVIVPSGPNGHLHFCVPPLPGPSFGGVYQIDGQTCHRENPLTSTCSCPSGYGQQSYATMVDQDVASAIVICLR